MGKHWILYWIQENKRATYFFRSRLFTYIMKNYEKFQLQLVQSIEYWQLLIYKKKILTACMPLSQG